MNCKQARRLLSEYLDDSLAAGPCQEVRQHLCGCPACTHLHRSLVRSTQALAAIPVFRPPAHLGEAVIARAAAASSARAGHSGRNAPGFAPRPLLTFSVMGSLAAVLTAVILLELMAPGYNFLFSGGAPTVGLGPSMAGDSWNKALLPLRAKKGVPVFAGEVVVNSMVAPEMTPPPSAAGLRRSTRPSQGSQGPALPGTQRVNPSDKNIFHKKLAKAVAGHPDVVALNRSIAERNREIELENRRISLSNQAIKDFNAAIRRQNQLAETRGARPLRQSLVPLWLYKTKLELSEAGV